MAWRDSSDSQVIARAVLRDRGGGSPGTTATEVRTYASRLWGSLWAFAKSLGTGTARLDDIENA